MELELLKYLAPLGVGGMLGGMIFLMYRKDVLAREQRTELREARFIEVIAQVTGALERQALTNEKVEHAVNNFINYLVNMNTKRVGPDARNGPFG